MDLTDIYRIFHPMAVEYTFFSSAQGNFSKIDHILGLKQVFLINKNMKYHIYFNGLGCDKIKNEQQEKLYKDMEIENILFNDQWVIEEIREEI
jgi:hypothetical protein